MQWAYTFETLDISNIQAPRTMEAATFPNIEHNTQCAASVYQLNQFLEPFFFPCNVGVVSSCQSKGLITGVNEKLKVVDYRI